MDGWVSESHLLHDAGLAFGKGNVSSRFVLDELDVNLPSLAAGLILVIVIGANDGWGFVKSSVSRKAVELETGEGRGRKRPRTKRGKEGRTFLAP